MSTSADSKARPPKAAETDAERRTAGSSQRDVGEPSARPSQVAIAGRKAVGDKREAIMSAALELFVERGFYGTIVPDIAKSWSWSADGKALTFKLQEGVTWHDGKPFTAKDVVCTFDLLLGKT